jgi:hypothetical protein
VLALALTGCERGCLSTWLSEHGLGDRSHAPMSPAGEPRAVDLSGIDCSDGLLRCVEGHVEASRAAHLPYPCGAASQGVEGRQGQSERGGCACPWELVNTCTAGCAEDGLEVIAAASDGAPTSAWGWKDSAAQLCRPEEPVARDIVPGDMPVGAGDRAVGEICSDEGVACRDGIVRVCDRRGQPMRAVGRCLYGCATQIALDDADTDITHRSRTFDPGAAKHLAAVLSILCRRDHAERR